MSASKQRFCERIKIHQIFLKPKIEAYQIRFYKDVIVSINHALIQMCRKYSRIIHIGSSIFCNLIIYLVLTFQKYIVVEKGPKINSSRHFVFYCMSC